MLALESPRWNELPHAYGRANDIPALLQQLSEANDEGLPLMGKEPWSSLWSSLCHQLDVYPASYAAVPHIVAIAAGKTEKQRLAHLAFIGSVEAYRHRKAAPAIPSDLELDYFSSLRQAAGLVLENLELHWDETGYAILLGCLAVVRGYPRLGNAILRLPEQGVCPVCGTYVPPLGYDLNM